MSITNTLALNQSYIVLHEKTKQPYVGENGDVFIYLNPKDAEVFLKEHAGTYLAEPEFYKPETICNICFGAGARRIVVKMPGNTQERYEDLTKMPKKKYFNHNTNKALNLLHETKKKEYLLRLGNGKFIVPIKIRTGSDVVIEYSIAKIKDKNYFLCFTNLDEYHVWEKQVQGFQPLEITFDELVELTDNDDCIINVSGVRYLLNQDKIKIIREHKSNM